MKHDGIALLEQTMGYGRANVPDATNKHADALRFHGYIL
jgi:hypothetical protein